MAAEPEYSAELILYQTSPLDTILCLFHAPPYDLS